MRVAARPRLKRGAQRCVDALEDVKPEDKDLWSAAAKRAKELKYKEEPEKASLYRGINCQMQEVMNFFTSLKAAKDCIMKLNDPNTLRRNNPIFRDCSDEATT